MSEAMTPEELARRALSPWGVTHPEYDNLFDAIVLACNVARNAALEEAAKVCDRRYEADIAYANKYPDEDGYRSERYAHRAKFLASAIRALHNEGK